MFLYFVEQSNSNATIPILTYLNRRSGVKAMYRLLGIVHMNPEIKLEQWDHSEVRILINLILISQHLDS